MYGVGMAVTYRQVFACLLPLLRSPQLREGSASKTHPTVANSMTQPTPFRSHQVYTAIVQVGHTQPCCEPKRRRVLGTTYEFEGPESRHPGCVAPFLLH